MADHPNVEIARKGYEAFASGDMEAVMATLADDIVWHTPGNNILSGDKVGKDAVLNFFGLLAQESEGTFKNEIHDLLANDDHGVALVNQSVTRNGKTIEGPGVHVFHMDNGQMTEFWAFNDDQEKFDEVWS
jgi:ketosteroid isomerase-like protein